MSAINTAQDFVKGLDFSAINPQTAAQHNQLVELATPLAITSSVGVGFVLTTTDTNVDEPDVPNPNTAADYNKWKRYVWHRRPYAGSADKTSKFYAWNDDVTTSDATYLKWLAVDIASQTTIEEAFRQVTDGVINGTTTFTSATAAFTEDDEGKYIVATGIPAGTTILTYNSATNVTMSAAATASATDVLTSIQNELETPLQCALDYLVVQSANAEATANAANSTVTNLQTACIGSEDPTSITTPLLDQIEANAAAIATDGNELDDIREWASGNPDNLTDNNGVNGKIAALQDTVEEMGATAVPVSRITPGTPAGAMLRTSADGSAVEWYDPTSSGSKEFQTFYGAGANVSGTVSPVSQGVTTTLSPGTYMIYAVSTGVGQYANASHTIKLEVACAGNTTLASPTLNPVNAANYPITLVAMGKFVVPSGTASSALTVSITSSHTSTDYTSRGIQLVAIKVSAKTTV